MTIRAEAPERKQVMRRQLLAGLAAAVAIAGLAVPLLASSASASPTPNPYPGFVRNPNYAPYTAIMTNPTELSTGGGGNQFQQIGAKFVLPAINCADPTKPTKTGYRYEMTIDDITRGISWTANPRTPVRVSDSSAEVVTEAVNDGPYIPKDRGQDGLSAWPASSQ